MRRNIRFILLLLKLKISRTLAFRFSFFGGFFSDGMMFVTELLTFSIIYANVDSIGGWSRGQMIIFIGTFSIMNAFNMLIFFFGIVTIPDKIKVGELDQYLTKPVNPLLRITFENMNLGSFPLLIFSIMIVMYGVKVEGIDVSLSVLFSYSVLVLLMTVLYYDMELILRSIPFLVISANGIMRLEDHLLDLNFRVPGVLFKGVFKIIFYFVVPYGVMATVPTQLISGALTFPGLIQGVCIAVIFTAFALWFWRFGLKHY